MPSARSAGIDAFHATIDFLLDRGVSLLADLSFRHGLNEARLLPHTARRRFMARQQIRPASGDARRVAKVMESGAFDWSVFEPLDLCLPRLIVDTRDEYTPDLAAIITFCADRVGRE